MTTIIAGDLRCKTRGPAKSRLLRVFGTTANGSISIRKLNR